MINAAKTTTRLSRSKQMHFSATHKDGKEERRPEGRRSVIAMRAELIDCEILEVGVA